MAANCSIHTRSFGLLNNTQETTLYTLRNANGVSASITDFGATLVSFKCPDRNGNIEDIVLGYDNALSYANAGAYMGATVGRFANRIADARFELNGTEYQLDANGGVNHLHGGLSGFNSRIWHAQIREGDEPSLRLSLFSPDGDQGYPGNLTVHITYSLSNTNQLCIKVDARSDTDTPVSITNHSYFNLAGSGPIDYHWLQVFSDTYTPLNSNQIPTGELAKVENTPFDFRDFHQVGERINLPHEQIKIGSGYDHNFMTPAAHSGELEVAAKLADKSSGRELTLSTNAPGLQLYTANFLEDDHGKGALHKARHALCLEPQHIPDAPNNTAFPSCILKAGERYTHTMVFEVSAK